MIEIFEIEDRAGNLRPDEVQFLSPVSILNAS